MHEGFTRRNFVSSFLAASAAGSKFSLAAPVPVTRTVGDAVQKRAKPFSMGRVRLLDGAFRNAQSWNLGYLNTLPVNRLIFNFQENAGIASSAMPLGGWEKPDCELRGHFTGHFLSACSLMYASTGDPLMKAKAEETVAALAVCQRKLSGGYLSAFPVAYFDRLKNGQKVWAPFYTYHKIMAGLLDSYEYCGSGEALRVAAGMADWVKNWTAPIDEPAMQRILNTEFGGMSEVLYNLYALTGEGSHQATGDRFSKTSFYEPLARHRDELKGLHANTHIPQVIAAARRYELTGDPRYREIATFFWSEITGARAYATGGTSNGEFWQVDPGQLALELSKSIDTAECCCVYNMLKLSRHLYQWTGDPRYFDYYERVLLNHRLGTIHPDTGATMYYQSLTPGAWKTFSTPYDSFWCCTGTGVEDFSKLNDSIYFEGSLGPIVNLFIPSELKWPEKGLRLRQETSFPAEPLTRLSVQLDHPAELMLQVRIPGWIAGGGSARLNGELLPSFAGAGSYLEVKRVWKSGDVLELNLPMQLRTEAMADDPELKAYLYGPLALAGRLGSSGLNPSIVTGPGGPKFREHPIDVPALSAAGDHEQNPLKPQNGDPLAFRAESGSGEIRFEPLNRILDERYSVYWRTRKQASA